MSIRELTAPPTLGDLRRALEELRDVPDETLVCSARYRPLGVYKIDNERFVTVALPDYTTLDIPYAFPAQADMGAGFVSTELEELTYG